MKKMGKGSVKRTPLSCQTDRRTITDAIRNTGKG